MSFQTESFGRFYLVDKVATGGMAEVFKAKSFSHGGFEKLLVIKRILGHLSDNDEFVEMFIDEAKITVSLQHPNIVQIYDFGRIRENYYLSMECVEGKDVKGILRKLAQRRKLFPTEFAVYIAHEMCKGLDYAHKKADAQGSPLRIIHRDISPSNILVSYNGEVKIADFGIAKAESSAYDTKDGVLKGKFEYMSPEQASGKELDNRSDIFSAGIILHEMLTGRRLFKTESDVKTLERIKTGTVAPPSMLNPAIPPRLDQIVLKALSVDPTDRYVDGRELQQALLEFLYPATPDLTRESLGHFMHELFSQEVEEERGRLLEGTRVASEMYAAEPSPSTEQEWQASAATTAGTISTQPSRWPWAVALGAVLLLGAVGAWALTRQPQERVVERLVQAEAPTTGSVQLKIEPAAALAKVSLDGKEIGSGSLVQSEGLPVGSALALRVEAEGYLPYEESLTLVAGERLRQMITLLPVPAPEPERLPTPPPEQTPPPRVETPAPSPEPPPAVVKATEPGTLQVFAGKAGPATVSVNGKPWGESPPMIKQSLPPGTYSVTVTPKDGSDPVTRSVTVTSGETAKANF